MNNLLEDNDTLIKSIAAAMAHGNDHRFCQFSKELASGYTYVGQFLAHELAPMTSIERASRTVSGLMDLDCLYDIKHSGLLFDNKGRFKFSDKAKLDFQRTADGVAIIPERRNDDNVNVGQLHLFFQRLHNHFINQGLAKNAQEAKRLVVLTFQLMVVEDYLRRIMDDSVYQHMIVNNDNYLANVKAPWFDIFRFATFRFGHSMIRNSYTLRLVEDDEDAQRKLSELFLSCRCPRQMTDDDYIDWRAFFCVEDESRFEGVMPIDTRISTIMTDIPGDDGHSIAINIAVRNIKSELAAGLPSGLALAKTVRNALPGTIKKSFCLLNENHMTEATFNKQGLQVKDLTIWLYMLLESQIINMPHKLGIVASSIDTHVLKQSIENAQLSIYNQGKYDFDRVVEELGNWGQTLKSFAIHNKTKGCGAVTMADLVNHLHDEE
ncbi:MAG: hypothetical protein MJK04_07420 [Psychrosphaera sp.]|nr:hypothetical protein [Psychrosphaera sp.]